MPKQIFLSPDRVWNRVHKRALHGSALIFGDAQMNVQHSVGWVEGSCRANKTSSIRSAVSTELRLQTDRQTQGRCYIVAALAQRRAGETPGGVSVIPAASGPSSSSNGILLCLRHGGIKRYRDPSVCLSHGAAVSG